VILGSGLGKFVDGMEDGITIPYADIPDYPRSTISGHAGEWVFGYIKKKPTICASGRFHYYEGFPMEKITLPVSVIHALGCRQIIITNAAGWLKKAWQIGDLTLLRGYLDYTFSLQKNKPEIVNIEMSDKKLNQIRTAASELRLQLREGIYSWSLGPSYETPAEIQDIISLGGNAAGMSTVPEMMKAQEVGLEIVGISCLTNYGAGMDGSILSHTDVLETSHRANAVFSSLISEIV
jgi:purine-nucleoside phosphorylase